MSDDSKPYAFSIDYRKEGRSQRGTLVNRGFWIHRLPRPLLTCRALGHVPVVDGTTGYRDRPGARWVCCARCGLRPDPQGSLNALAWDIGESYDGPLPGEPPLPGDWPAATGAIGGQVIIGKPGLSGFGMSAKVGNAGSEHTLAADVRLPFGALYLHTETFGTWLQRRLNPIGYDSRVIEFDVSDGRIRWKLWAKRDGHSKNKPRWQDGTLTLDPRDRLLGPARYSYETHDTTTATVRMPDGDDHEVTLTLKRQRYGRMHGAGKLSWTVEWDSRPGIPYRHNSWKGDEVLGSSVTVSDAAVDTERWAADACAGIAADVSKMRTRNKWHPPTQPGLEEDDDMIEVG